MVNLPNATSATAVIRGHARRTPDHTAMIFVDDVERVDGATRWSYARLDAEATRIGAWLGARYPVGTRVLLLYPAGFDFAAAYLGCLYAGTAAVPAPLPGRYRNEQVRVSGIAMNAAASVILTDTKSLPAVRAWAEAEQLTGTRVLATDGRDLPDPGAWTPEEADHRTLAMLQYTSGSTGEPKGVMVSHGNLLHNVDSQSRAFGLTAASRLGGWIPHYHDMGLLGQLLPALLVGATCVLMRPSAFLQRPYHWLRLIDTYDIQCSAAPNFAYEMCCARTTDEQLAGLDLSRWRTASNGSERVDITTLDAFAKRFAPAGFREDALCPCYGMAEATVFVSGEADRKAVVTTVDAERLKQHRLVPTQPGVDLVSCGTPRDYEVLIVDPRTGGEAATGGIGEIWLRGPSLAREYWNDPVATERAFAPDGFLRTGDLGTVHDGELYVTGRLQELLTVHGHHIYPQDVERELRNQHSELASAGAVFTVPVPEVHGEEALVVTHEVDGSPAQDRLRLLANEIRQTVDREFGIAVGGVALLRRGRVRRTTSGKIQRMEMRRLFLNGELNALYADHEPGVMEMLRSRNP
ncbi:fatty acyl-AMP ligase [Streptomyces kronopolitis]|uniref:fatty acyl-AMP ligase n=1 Tax=Streptomyces kronopolitis TaxID=1612435 RepID=UPI0020BD7816|nr:fatty acyl-AMP ligase [Streptomyces kronopolitis]MCL6296868.1 fatty acyl-AMP ligase [Streptomyces kronopolitis]